MLKYTALFEVTYPNRVAVLIRREAIACCWSAGRAHLAPGIITSGMTVPQANCLRVGVRSKRRANPCQFRLERREAGFHGELARARLA